MIYRVHTVGKTPQSKSHIVGYIDLCQHNTSSTGIYNTLIESKIVPAGWCDVMHFQRIPYGVINGMHDYTILVNGVQRFYLYPIASLLVIAENKSPKIDDAAEKYSKLLGYLMDTSSRVSYGSNHPISNITMQTVRTAIPANFYFRPPDEGEE